MSNSARTIVVFESRSRWEPELQRQFLDEPVRVRGCRSWNELALLEADVCVVELPDDATSCLQWLSKLVTRSPVPSVIVICSSEAADLEWPLRDAGVREVLIDELSGDRLARICRRFWQIA